MLLLLSLANASAFYTPTEGVRAMGRGGAYIVRNHDLSAQHYNPAALRNIHGGLAQIDLALVSQSVTFEREGFDPVVNQGKPYTIPSMGVAYGFGHATVAFGFWTPYAPAFQYAEDGPQRFSMIDSTLIQTSVGPSLSVDVLPWLTLGGSVAWNTLTVGRQVVLSTMAESDENYATDKDIPVNMLVQDLFAIGTTLAVSARPNDRFEVALSAQLPVNYGTTGYLHADFSDHFLFETGLITEAAAGDEDIRVDVGMPLLLRGGMAWTPSDRLEVELSGDYERWSEFDEIVLTDVDLHVDTTLGGSDITDDIVLPSAYRDSFSVRLGGELEVNDRVDARGGVMFESSGVPTQILSVDLVDGPKLGGGVGATAHIGRVDVDASFFALKLPQQTVQDSQVQQIVVNVLDSSIEDGDIVGNGSFESLIWIPSVGLVYHFGKG